MLSLAKLKNAMYLIKYHHKFLSYNKTKNVSCAVLFGLIFISILKSFQFNYHNINKNKQFDQLLVHQDLKYILLWTSGNYGPYYHYNVGQKDFIKSNCSNQNCYITYDPFMFSGNITKFDALIFNGRNQHVLRKTELPESRSPHQKYIYVNMETPQYYPECNKHFEDFFNWTATYRLDSDVPFTYISIKDTNGDTVGPKINMNWIKETKEVGDDILQKLRNKSKAAAWFVSHCSSFSHREGYVKRLQAILQLHGFSIDIYGRCGKLKCPPEKPAKCNEMIESDYFFYLAFENSISEDYVTEKILTAVNNYAVPVVYGGANYTRFLPPGSFIDAAKEEPGVVAAKMVELIENLNLYKEYFKWKPYYKYSNPSDSNNVCELCAALNNETLVKTKTRYRDFRKWWNPHYAKEC